MSPLTRPAWLLSLTAILCAGVYQTQKSRLKSLQEKIAEAGQTAAPKQSPESTERNRSATGEEDFPDHLSMAGLADVSEVSALIGKPVSASAAALAKRTAAPPKDALVRLQEILPSMGAGAVEKLYSEIEAPPGDPGGDMLLHIYSLVNPRQAFLLMASRSRKEGKPGDPLVSRMFSNWAQKNPAAAIQWYQAAAAKGEPEAALPENQFTVVRTLSRSDPAKSISAMLTLLRSGQTDIPVTHGSFLGQEMQNPAERLSFLAALDKAAENPVDAELVAKMRTAILGELNRKLIDEPYADAVAVVDGGYSPAERREFAAERARNHGANEGEWARWAPWIASIDLPADARHPLVSMAASCGVSVGNSEPAWLDQVPQGDLKNLAIAAYVFQERDRDPEIAAKWLARLPAGKGRQEMARHVAESWASKDPAAATAFLKNERAEE